MQEPIKEEHLSVFSQYIDNIDESYKGRTEDNVVKRRKQPRLKIDIPQDNQHMINQMNVTIINHG